MLNWTSVIAASLAGLAVMAGTPAFAQWGSIEGQVVLVGDVPTLKPLVKMGDAAAKDPAVCAAVDVPDESLVVDTATKGVANVCVYLRRKPDMIHPDLVAKPGAEIVYDQKNCKFIPHIVVAQAGQTIRVLNDDAAAHNTRGTPLKNPGFNFILGPNDRKGVGVNSLKAGELLPVGVSCDIHPWMKGWWVVVDHPYATISDATGKFKIANLPPGTHEFRVWHERPGYLEKSLEVKVEADKTTSIPTIKVPVATLLK